MRKLLFCTFLCASACGRSSIATFSAARDEATGGATGVAGGVGSAGGAPCPDPDPEDIVSLEAIRSATLFGATLHVQGSIDGQDNYALIDLSSNPAHLVDLRPDLLGSARWIHESGPYHARLVGSQLDVLDAAAPESPVVVSSTTLSSAPTGGFSNAIASDGSGLFLALWAAEEQGNFLNRLDLSDPTQPGPPVRLENYPLEFLGDRAEARGSLWLTWAPGSVALYDLTAAKSINNHSFATNGVHNYGELTRLETDGMVAATTMVNPAYAFLYYANNINFVVYSSFGGGDKALLAVVDGVALVAVPRGADGAAVVGFEVATQPASEQPAKSTGMDVVLQGSSKLMGEFRALARDSGRLLVSDGDNLFDVPIGATTTVSPLVVVRTEEATCP